MPTEITRLKAANLFLLQQMELVRELSLKDKCGSGVHSVAFCAMRDAQNMQAGIGCITFADVPRLKAENVDLQELLSAAEDTLRDRTGDLQGEIDNLRETLIAIDSEVLLTGHLKDIVNEALGPADRTAPQAGDAEGGVEPFQTRVDRWLLACFGETIARDKVERNHRFLEEALELVQSGGCTASEAHQLVDYVFGRPVGDMLQEVGGVMNTLAALCLAYGLDMDVAAETELARVWTKVDQIRAKQAAKPKHSPLPEAALTAWGSKTEASLRREGLFLHLHWTRGREFQRRVYEPQGMPLSPALADALVMAIETSPPDPAPEPKADERETLHPHAREQIRRGHHFRMDLAECGCDEPLIRCDHRGCLCEICGLPERLALPDRAPEPKAVAWFYEIARYRNLGTKEYSGWEERVSFNRPSIPPYECTGLGTEAAIRNLTPLYLATPDPAPAPPEATK